MNTLPVARVMLVNDVVLYRSVEISVIDEAISTFGVVRIPKTLALLIIVRVEAGRGDRYNLEIGLFPDCGRAIWMISGGRILHLTGDLVRLVDDHKTCIDLFEGGVGVMSKLVAIQARV